MKNITRMLASCCLVLSSVSTSYADKICIKGSARGSKVSLKKTTVASDKNCPKGALEVFNTDAFFKNEAVDPSKITDLSITGSKLANATIGAGKLTSETAAGATVLTADGVGGASFSSLPVDATLAKLNANQTFTGTNTFPLIDLSTSPGTSVPSVLGRLNKDNVPVAWGRVTATGALDSNFNITSSVKNGTGSYTITLASPTTSGFTLIPSVIPEIDSTATVPPSGAATDLRIPAANMFVSGSTFEVFIYNGTGALVDNDFHFIVMGR